MEVHRGLPPSSHYVVPHCVMYYSLFKQPLSFRYLGNFQYFEIANNAAMYNLFHVWFFIIGAVTLGSASTHGIAILKSVFVCHCVTFPSNVRVSVFRHAHQQSVLSSC